MKKRLCTLLISAAAMATSMFAAPTPSILTIKESITDKTIVYPESFETDTKDMLTNWYIKNYTVLDKDVEKHASKDVSDAVYIKRLKSMPTIIEMPFNQIVRSYIQMYTNKKRTLVETVLGMSLYYMPIFEQALEKEGLPLELKYLPVVESALNPNAISRVGATGLWQFMLGTAKNVGLEVNSLVDERRDPYRSSDKAAQYLKSLYGIYGDWSLAIAAYNCGPSNINKAIRRAGGNSDTKDFWSIYQYLPAETRGYVPAFIAANYVMTYFKEHNISPALAKRPLITDTLHITKRVNLQQISDVLDIPMEEIQILNPHFRQNIIPGDIRPYALSLPSQQVYSYIMSEDSIVAHNANLYARRTVVEPTIYEAPKTEREAYTKTVVKYHKVGRGETLSSIANRYGMTVSQVKKLNGLKRSSLQRNQRIKVNSKVTAYRYTTTKNDDSKNSTAQNTEEIVPNKEIVNTHTTTHSKSTSSKETASNSTKKKTVEKSTKEESSKSTKDSKKESKNVSSKEKSSSKSESSKSKKDKLEKEETHSSKSLSKKEKEKEKEKETAHKTSKSKSSKDSKSTKESKSSKDKDKKGSSNSHTVKSGENLSTIAGRYPGVSPDDIRKANGIKGDKIKPGESLKIPKSTSKKK